MTRSLLDPRRARIGRALMLLLLAGSVVLLAVSWQRTSVDASFVATVRRGALTVQITASGTLRPIAAMTYRSPILGRETEIVELAPEGLRVNEGDLLIRFETTELQLELDRAQRELRQAQADLQVAEGQRLEAEGSVAAVSEGEGVLAVEEARVRLELTRKKAERLRQELAQLQPLLEKGFITREELSKTSDQLEQVEEELRLTRKRTDIAVGITHPRERQRATVQLAQKKSQVENATTRVQEAQTRVTQLRQLLDNCRVHARRPGLVVYEESLNTIPRRKIRVGDRVSSSQGIVTIPEVDRMLVEATVGESELHRIRPGQAATVRLEAFPHLRLGGRVVRVGTLASSSTDHQSDEKRFDLIVELDSSTRELRPGMTARTDVVVGTREAVLLVPVTAVFQRPGTLVAHVVGRRGIETRRIDPGESNDQFVEVLTGLRENERVMLIEPAAADRVTGEGKPALQSR